MPNCAALISRFIIAALMFIFTAAALFACNSVSGGDVSSDADNNPALAIIADGASDYVIIRPDIASDTVTDAAVKLKNAIRDAIGAELVIATDWIAHDAAVTPAEHEILVGQTNRTQSQTALGSLTGNAYYAGLSGDYLVLTGTTDDMVAQAVDAFISEYVTGKTDLSLPIDYAETLSMPTALSPANEAVGVSLTPTFEFTSGTSDECTVEVLAPDGQGWSVAYTAAVNATGGIKTSCTLDSALDSCSTYKWRVNCGGLTADGGIFTTEYDYSSHPANAGVDYAFDGSISEEVLDNYLSRAINHFYFESTDAAALDQNKRFILNAGAKFIGRASTMWGMYSSDEATIEEYAKAIADVHDSDPDIIFEACIFETTFTSINDIPIPAWVFEAFGQKPETRNFSYDAMLFPEGDYINMWGDGCSVPDMRQTETQMWFYYRAALFIDAGFESIHMGQVHLIGARDKDFASWTKVCNMIREYANIHARRHFVLLNAHTHGIKGTDGMLLFDFHRYPSRCKVPDSEVDHAPSEENPQKVIFARGYEDSLYGRSLGGKTHSGWTTKHLQYLVELDNYVGYYADKVDKSTADWWGFDEISWFVNQPYLYQREYLAHAYKWVSETDGGVGHFEMPGTRTAAIRSGDDLKTITQTYFYPFNKAFYSGGTDVENIIREVWIADNS